MIAATVANRGVLMQPYLVAQELAPDLSVIKRDQAEQRATVMTPGQADELGRMMVVGRRQRHRASAQPIDGVTVAGKTGTADTGFTSDRATSPTPGSSATRRPRRPRRSRSP